eukprot:TRINITY_DN5739_c0_g1_i1.p1 TRINITY_DN5739_c0_g1~~TRINITY_DN5739_c0_g1_i1.p1  ORF type:complete len:859 (+),score=74.58 TRINITY_DN5739_c0_g1_i1:70-2577(+)
MAPRKFGVPVASLALVRIALMFLFLSSITVVLLRRPIIEPNGLYASDEFSLDGYPLVTLIYESDYEKALHDDDEERPKDPGVTIPDAVSEDEGRISDASGIPIGQGVFDDASDLVEPTVWTPVYQKIVPAVPAASQVVSPSVPVSASGQIRPMIRGLAWSLPKRSTSRNASIWRMPSPAEMEAAVSVAAQAGPAGPFSSSRFLPLPDALWPRGKESAASSPPFASAVCLRVLIYSNVITPRLCWTMYTAAARNITVDLLGAHQPGGSWMGYVDKFLHVNRYLEQMLRRDPATSDCIIFFTDADVFFHGYAHDVVAKWRKLASRVDRVTGLVPRIVISSECGAWPQGTIGNPPSGFLTTDMAGVAETAATPASVADAGPLMSTYQTASTLPLAPAALATPHPPTSGHANVTGWTAMSRIPEHVEEASVLPYQQINCWYKYPSQPSGAAPYLNSGVWAGTVGGVLPFLHFMETAYRRVATGQRPPPPLRLPFSPFSPPLVHRDQFWFGEAYMQRTVREMFNITVDYGAEFSVTGADVEGHASLYPRQLNRRGPGYVGRAFGWKTAHHFPVPLEKLPSASHPASRTTPTFAFRRMPLLSHVPGHPGYHVIVNATHWYDSDYRKVIRHPPPPLRAPAPVPLSNDEQSMLASAGEQGGVLNGRDLGWRFSGRWVVGLRSDPPCWSMAQKARFDTSSGYIKVPSLRATPVVHHTVGTKPGRPYWVEMMRLLGFPDVPRMCVPSMGPADDSSGTSSGAKPWLSTDCSQLPSAPVYWHWHDNPARVVRTDTYNLCAAPAAPLVVPRRKQPPVPKPTLPVAMPGHHVLKASSPPTQRPGSNFKP